MSKGSKQRPIQDKEVFDKNWDAIFKKRPEYPVWICVKCGDKYGKRSCGVATWHSDTCSVCGKHTVVTEPRDFGHLKDGWEKEKSA